LNISNKLKALRQLWQFEPTISGSNLGDFDSLIWAYFT